MNHKPNFITKKELRELLELTKTDRDCLKKLIKESSFDFLERTTPLQYEFNYARVYQTDDLEFQRYEAFKIPNEYMEEFK